MQEFIKKTRRIFKRKKNNVKNNTKIYKKPLEQQIIKINKHIKLIS